MADRFFDTSAAVKHYRAESGTAGVDAFLAEVGSRHFVSSLCVVEFHSVMAKHVRTGQVTPAEFHAVSAGFRADVAAGLWLVAPPTPGQFDEAQRLIVRHGLTRALYPQDAYHLAVALLTHRASPLDAFVCADTNLCAFAAAEGLSVVNPEIP